jgi:hypothetical protein
VHFVIRVVGSIQDWFGLLQEITQLPLVAELLTLFGAGLLPISMAAPLGEKERARTPVFEQVGQPAQGRFSSSHTLMQRA